MKKKVISYYRPRDFIDLANARRVEEPVEIASRLLARMPDPVYWVAGPLTSGPRKSEENRARLHATILQFKKKGAATIDYLPLQMQTLKILRREAGGVPLSNAEEHKLQERLRDELYAPIFRSGKIKKLFLMPGSESSLNAQWMRGFAHARGIPVRRISEKVVLKCVAAARR